MLGVKIHQIRGCHEYVDIQNYNVIIIIMITVNCQQSIDASSITHE